MPAALDIGRVAAAGAGPSPTLRRLLVRLVLAMQIPLALASAGLLASYWDNQRDHATAAMQSTAASILDLVETEHADPAHSGSSRLERLFTRVRLPAGWSAGLADDRGMVLAHSSDPALVGGAVPGALHGEKHAASANLREWTAAQGQHMLTYRLQAPVQGWTAFVVVPRSVLLAPVWEAAGRLLLGLLAMAALGLWGAVRLSRRIVHSLDALQQAAHALPAHGPVFLPRLTFTEAEELAAALEASGRAVQRANAAAQRGEQQLAAVLRTAGNAIIVTDSLQRIVVFNDAAETIFGWSKAQMVGRPLQALFTARSWQRFSARCATAAATGGPATAATGTGLRSVCQRASGSNFAVELLVSQFVDAAGERFCTLILRDITERLRAEQSLLAAHREVQRVNDGFQRALMKETDSRMAGIARELHDSVGSTLAGISLLAAGGRSATQEPRLQRLLEQVQQQVQSAADRVRQISRGIMPAGSDAGALLPALEQFAHAIGAAQGVECTLHWRGSFEDIAPEVGGHVYRVVQEATANALRHGQASRIRVVLAQVGERCRLTVVDNGCGCNLAQVPASHAGMGVKSMRARAAAIDGQLELRSRPGGGCRVTLQWHMKAAPT